MAEPITIAQLIDASEDAQALSLFVNADAATQVPRRLANPIETLEYWRNYMSALATGKNGVDGINGVSATIESLAVATGAAGTAASVVTSGTPTARTFALTIPRGDKGVDGSFSQKAYTTYAAMDADKLNIPANTSITVTNDTDTTKNGMYAYNGTVFTKSAYDPLTQAKTYTDTSKADTLIRVQNVFTTKALLTASALLDGSNALVSGDTTSTNNGFYKKTAGVWSKAVYDPVALAKTETQSLIAANNVTIKDGLVADSDVKTVYLSGNLVTPTTPVVLNAGLNTSLVYTVDSLRDCKIVNVTAGDVLYIHNHMGEYRATEHYGNAFFNADPSKGAATRVVLAGAAGVIAAKDGLPAGIRVVVPVGATHLVLNTRFATTVNPIWYVSTKAFTGSYAATDLYIDTINNLKMLGTLNVQANNDIMTGNSDGKDIYDFSNVKQALLGYYLDIKGALVGGGYGGGGNYMAYKFKVTEGLTYFFKFVGGTQGTAQPIYSTSYATTVKPAFFTADRITPEPTDVPEIFKIYIPIGEGIKAIFLNIRLNTTGTTGVLDITSTLSIQKNRFETANIGNTRRGVATIDGTEIVDEFARTSLATQARLTRFTSKKVFALGDSITQGTEGGYVKYLDEAYGTSVDNYGSSGARPSRVADIIMGGTGAPKRDPATDATVWSTKDFTELACVTLMIGTNGGVGDTINLSSLPTGYVTDYANELDYWALFPNTFEGNIALVIEYIRYKAPYTEIYIVSPPYDTNLNAPQTLTPRLIQPLKDICALYGVCFINGTYDSGLGYKFMKGSLNIFTYDGTHLNAMGNRVFGTFLANRVLGAG